MDIIQRDNRHIIFMKMENERSLQMKKLEQILSELMNIENDMQALSVVLTILKIHYETNSSEELTAIICVAENEIKYTKSKLADTITELDYYLLEEK